METDKDGAKTKQREKCGGDNEMGKNAKKSGSLHESSCWDSFRWGRTDEWIRIVTCVQVNKETRQRGQEEPTSE